MPVGVPRRAKGNILLVANWESSVGYAWWLMENFWVEIARHFECDGTRTFLIYPCIDRLPNSIAEASITVEERGFQSLGLRETLALLAFVRRHRIRNVYLTDSPFLRPLYAMLRVVGVRQIVIHDHTPGDRPPTHGLRRLAKVLRHRLPWVRADFFIGVTPFVQRRLIENANLPPSRCGHASNGIVPIEPEEQSVDVRAEFGLPADAIVVVTTGRASFYKRIDFLIELSHRVVHEKGLKEVYFLFFGDGPDMAVFRALAQSLRLGPHFTFAGKRSDLRAMLASCDIGIHASRGEVGYALSILEYMSAGLPTVVPDHPSTSVATEHGVTGLVYRSDDLDSALESLVRLVRDPADRARLGGNARRAVAERYRLSQTNRELLEILDIRFH